MGCDNVGANFRCIIGFHCYYNSKIHFNSTFANNLRVPFSNFDVLWIDLFDSFKYGCERNYVFHLNRCSTCWSLTCSFYQHCTSLQKDVHLMGRSLPNEEIRSDHRGELSCLPCVHCIVVDYYFRWSQLIVHPSGKCHFVG